LLPWQIHGNSRENRWANLIVESGPTASFCAGLCN
jgi:hypothetical protein